MANKYAIKNLNGTWWTGECFGAEQNKQEYNYDELPDEIDDLKLFYVSRFSFAKDGKYENKKFETEAVVKVVRVGNFHKKEQDNV